MDAHGFLQLLGRRWNFVAIGLMLGLLGATVVALLTPIGFVSTAQVMLRTPGWNAVTSGDVAETSPYQADQFAQQRARTYADLIGTPGFASRLAANIHSSPDAVTPGGEIAGRVVPDTVLIEVTAKQPTSSGARELANAAAAELVDEIRLLETPSGSRIATIEPILTSPAVAPPDASEPDVPFILLIGGAIGFLAGITAATLTTDRRRSPATADLPQESST